METIKHSHWDPPDSTFSHIGQDIRKSGPTCQIIYKSTIKKDHPAFGDIAKQRRFPSPKEAKIFLLEAQINEQKSLTASHFVKQTPTERTALAEVAKLALGTKNLLKMDVDNKAMAYETTHKVYFPALVLEQVKGEQEQMTTSISQGDKEKVRLPLSNYRESFQNVHLSELDVAMPVQFKTPPVLRGDARSYVNQFETTNSRMFRGQSSIPQKQQAIKNNGCSIRHGDPEKCRYSVTTNQKFFKEKPLQRDLCGPNYVSNIVLGDDKAQWSLKDHRINKEPLSSIRKRYFISKQAKLAMAKSSVPIGDTDPDRAQQRVTETTSESFFKKPFVSFPYAKVSGANLLTKSKVKFGTENAVTRTHYSTTMRSNFPAMYQPVERRDCETTYSNVCLHYYGNESNPSTTATDFPPHNGVKRLMPDPAGMTKLTASHVQLPTTLTSEFRTSHNVSYPRKQIKRETYEAGRLHKSSLKLGYISVD